MNTNLITVMEMANILKISRSKAYLLANTNGCPIIKIGKLIRIQKDKLFEWLST